MKASSPAEELTAQAEAASDELAEIAPCLWYSVVTDLRIC